MEALYREHRNRALRIARRILKSHAEAEDVVQEVFTRLCAREGAEFGGRSAFSTWLYRIMVNSSINALRGRHRRDGLHASWMGEAPATPEDEATHRQAQELFGRALKELGGRQEQVVWLREVRGLSYPEISSLLGIPEGTVKSTLHRGRHRAYELLLALEEPVAAGEFA